MRVQMVDGKLHAGERNHRAIVVIILVCLYQALVDEPAAWPWRRATQDPGQVFYVGVYVE